MLPGLIPLLAASSGTPTPTPGGSLTYPTDLGAKLRMLWDAEGPLTGAAPIYDPALKNVSSWREGVNQIDFTRFVATNNTNDGVSYYATGIIGSRPSVKPAGLTSFSATIIGKLTLPFEVWATVYYATDSGSILEPLFSIQDQPGSIAVMVGGGGLLSSNNAFIYISTAGGSTQAAASMPAGVHTMRASFATSGISIAVDGGVAGTGSNGAWPASLTGCSVAIGGINVAGNAYRFNSDGTDAAKKNSVNILAVTDQLTTTEAADMLAFMNTRKV